MHWPQITLIIIQAFASGIWLCYTLWQCDGSGDPEVAFPLHIIPWCIGLGILNALLFYGGFYN